MKFEVVGGRVGRTLEGFRGGEVEVVQRSACQARRFFHSRIKTYSRMQDLFSNGRTRLVSECG